MTLDIHLRHAFPGFRLEVDMVLPGGLTCLFGRSGSGKTSIVNTVAGLLRARFEPCKRSHSLHVAFCPPMLRRPKVTMVQLRGPRTRIKAADIQSFGIRFDLRLVTASKQ